MHLKTRGGESVYCRHSSHDGFRVVVYAYITRLMMKVSTWYVMLSLPHTRSSTYNL
jgi:hypothetical protein